MYRHLVRPLLFKFDSEQVHDLLMSGSHAIGNAPALYRNMGKLFALDHAALECRIAGLKLPNPVMLAAGFDKNCKAVGLLAALGFGAVEIGSVTAKPQEGNPKPRIFRFPRSQALVNRMGFPSDGADIVSERLKHARQKFPDLILGINIGKSKAAPIEDALSDYAYTFKLVAEHADYVAINVSSPNTPGLRTLQDRDKLEELLTGIQKINVSQKPILLKVSPDLGIEQLQEIVECCRNHGISGIIATNTTLSREGLTPPTEETGGMSGQPLFEKSLAVVRQLAEISNKSIPIIAAGGISNSEQAKRMFEVGASAIQIYTALIYGGPGIVKEIKQGLVPLAK